MIRSFRHNGLKRLHERSDARHLPPQSVERISTILALLSVAESPQDLNAPNYRLHRLKGQSDSWSLRVSKNWRIVFRWDGGAHEVDFLDYH